MINGVPKLLQQVWAAIRENAREQARVIYVGNGWGDSYQEGQMADTEARSCGVGGGVQPLSLGVAGPAWEPRGGLAHRYLRRTPVAHVPSAVCPDGYTCS